MRQRFMKLIVERTLRDLVEMVTNSLHSKKKAGQDFHPARQIVSAYCEVCRS